MLLFGFGGGFFDLDEVLEVADFDFDLAPAIAAMAFVEMVSF